MGKYRVMQYNETGVPNNRNRKLFKEIIDNFFPM